MPDQSDQRNPDIVIQTALSDPIAIALAESLLEEAGIPFFTMDQNVAARQEGGNFIGWWTVLVPGEFESEAREILANLEHSK